MSTRIHPQARTTPKIRQEIKDSGLSDRQAAKARVLIDHQIAERRVRGHFQLAVRTRRAGFHRPLEPPGGLCVANRRVGSREDAGKEG